MRLPTGSSRGLDRVQPGSTGPDVQEMLRLHIEGSVRLDDLVAECKRLHDEGRIAQARKVLARADEMRERLEALEEAVKRRRPALFNRR